MLTLSDLGHLSQTLSGSRVLTVYVDSHVTDPAMRDAWRAALQTALRSARTHTADEDDRAAFDRASALLAEAHLPKGEWGGRGWAAFVTEDAVRYAGELPVRVATQAIWRDGVVVSPYLRVLKQQRPVVVALVGSRMARLFRYAEARLQTLETLEEEVPQVGGSERITVARSRGGLHAPARGAVGTEAADRRQVAAFQRLAATLAERVTRLAGTDAWVAVGGTAELARRAADALPRTLQARTLVMPSLVLDAPDDEIATEAKHAASALRATEVDGFMSHLADHAGHAGRSALGVPAVQRALLARAVDVLLVAPSFLEQHATEGEDLVRAALAQGADIEVLSGRGDERLAELAGGLAARLRFPLEPRVPAGADVGTSAAAQAANA